MKNVIHKYTAQYNEKKSQVEVSASDSIEVKNEKSQITILKEGKIEISQTDGAKINILKDGQISINTSENIKIASDAEIELSGKSVSINGATTLEI